MNVAETDIESVRAFNRVVTRRVGALESSFLGRGRPLAECRVLFEIGPGEGVRVAELRARLGLDSGYMSRLLRSLGREGLIVLAPDPADRRVRRATLTEAGAREWRTLDELSDGFARDLLMAVDPRRRERLVRAMAEVERLLTAASVAVAPVDPEAEEARACLARYVEELSTRFEAGFDPARSISAAAAEMRPPRGLFLLARLDGRAVGCGGLKAGREGGGEVKRMWVAPDVRGLGVARRLLAAIEEAAVDEFGLDTLRLETNGALREAQALYRASGYREVPAFSDEPYAHHWFEKDLSARA
ncbi:MarR family transcriptional regulator [Marivibrio halodurans]|uniref:MarR family transcriptional regulator n=1 Tax=Marivibrio halodurans TaxID=2039722 RepID=A0A8J7S0G0_9PROT|nr:bifunctional helix-turn-helix transcriptional regulator/GNAT family N-acetyltransferase [Marivibrio halodurans]MBP5857620.1 MarR family transcriptional regulator [Marivibrio halodurans]